MQTFNFQSNLPAARACLAHRGFRRIRLVSKNVCHAESNRFGPEQLARLEARLSASAATTTTGRTSRVDEAAAARHDAGLRLLAVGMRDYLQRHPSGKLLHDPLAAACILDRRVVEWREVAMSEDGRQAWGATPKDGSGTFISVRHSPEVFWAALLDDGPRPSTCTRGARGDGGASAPAAACAPSAAAPSVSLAAASAAEHVARGTGALKTWTSSSTSRSALAMAADLDAAGHHHPTELQPASEEAECPPRDWEGSELPPFVQPMRPSRNEGADALEGLAAAPWARPERVLMSTAHCVVVYDVYPKARVHVLILPRIPLAKPDQLTAGHAPLLRHMHRLAEWLAPRLRAQHPGLPPLRCGFHAVPSMRQMHLHLVSLDFESAEMKRPRHWIIFNTDYLVPPAKWAAMLEQHGCVRVNRAAEEAKLAAPMVCPLTGAALDSIEAVKAHVRSRTYRDAASDAGGVEGSLHLVFITR